MGSEVPLESLCELVVDCPHSTPVWTDSGHIVIRSKNIRGGRLDLAERSFTDTEHFRDRIRRAKPTTGDIVITREAPMGECAMIPEGLECCLGQRIVLLRPDSDKVVPRYLLYALQSPGVQWQIGGHEGTGSTVSNLRIPALEGLRISLPPLDEQRRIASMLGALDDKIELNRRMSRTLDELAQAIFKSWFVEFEISAHDRVGSPLGPIPSGWSVATVGDIAEVIDCLHSKKPERMDLGPPLLQLKNIRDDGLIDMGDTYCISEADYATWTSRMEARAGDCVITNVGRSGAVAQLPQGLRAALGRNMTGVRLRPEFPYPTYIIELLRSPMMKAEIELKLDAGTILSALNVRSIPGLRFPMPPVELVQEYEEATRPVRSRMEQLLAESVTLANLRDALLPRLLSGELSIT